MGDRSLARQYCRAAKKLIYRTYDFLVRMLFAFIYRRPGLKMAPIGDLLLLDSATTLAHKIRTGKVTSEEVLDSFIARIKQVNPTLNCLVADRFHEARQEAKAADDLIKGGTVSQEQLAKEKPFLGVPFTTKDCIPVEGLIYTSGLYKRRHIIAEEDADVIRLLRKAGAIPIGLTNVSELCMWWESSNVVHGRTNNPYDTNHIVGGSSGGEGCIQAAAGSAFGIGSDIGGSIRMPCFFNGIFGHKPSKGIVSNRGQYPVPNSEEQSGFLGIGPMCRRAEDLAPILKIIADKRADELRLDEPLDVRDIKFFYQENDTGAPLVSAVDPEISLLLRKLAYHLEKNLKVKPTKIQMKSFGRSNGIWVGNMVTDGPNFQAQLSNLDGKINLWFELIKWFFRLSNHTFIALCTALFENMGPGHGSDQHKFWISQRDEMRRDLIDLLGDDGVLLYPTHPTPAPFHNEPLFKPFNFSYTSIVNVLGFPATHCPMGLSSKGLPIGIQVISNHLNDRYCLAVARYIEKGFGGWVPPDINA